MSELAAKPRNSFSIVLVGLLLSPAVLMWFLGRGRLGLAYLFAGIIWVCIALTIYAFGGLRLRATDIADQATLLQLAATVPIAIVGIIHAFVVRSRSLARPWFSRWHGILAIYAIFLLAAFLIRSFWLQPFNIPSGSMIPALKPGDYVFANKSSYGYGRYSVAFGLGEMLWDAKTVRNARTPPTRGDIAIFRLPSVPKVDYVMRVIGLPGDRVQMKGGRLVLNGVSVETKPAGEELVPSAFGAPNRIARFEEILPSGRSYFVLDAGESRYSDNTDEYVVPQGHFFALGDNRDNSTDSRFQNPVGFIPFENLVGRATLIFGSGDPSRVFTWVR